VEIRNLILDWSGTMVDDLAPVWKTTNHVLAMFGRPGLTLERFRREFCLPVRVCYRRWAPDAPPAELERAFLEKYGQLQDEIRLLPRTRAFLEYCAGRGLPVLVASTVDEATYGRQAERFGLAGLIRRAYIGIEDKTEKIHLILSENALAPAATLFVGDMEHDIQAGRAGGVRTCAVLSGYNHAERLRALQPDFVCADLGEVQAILAGAGARCG
jgi:phosphoglycolate phosphatase